MKNLDFALRRLDRRTGLNLLADISDQQQYCSYFAPFGFIREEVFMPESLSSVFTIRQTRPADGPSAIQKRHGL